MQRQQTSETFVKDYKGNPRKATQRFQADAPRMAALGYFPISQSYQPGQYGCGAFIVALLLCLLIIGIVVFIYMLIVKPPGILSVVYEYRPFHNVVDSDESTRMPKELKVCPMCAEIVKGEARICRFCGHEFVNDGIKATQD